MENGNTNNTTTSQKITLDGKQVTTQQLDEAKANPSVRIIETEKNSYKTLKRMQG